MQSGLHDNARQASPSFSARNPAALGMFHRRDHRHGAGRMADIAHPFPQFRIAATSLFWSLRARRIRAVFAAGSHYAINVLASDQKELAQRFAARGADRWSGVEFDEGVGGAPLLRGTAAVFECFNRSRYEEGDHVIFVGEVERCTRSEGASPLLFHGGRYYTEHPL